MVYVELSNEMGRVIVARIVSVLGLAAIIRELSDMVRPGYNIAVREANV